MCSTLHGEYKRSEDFFCIANPFEMFFGPIHKRLKCYNVKLHTFSVAYKALGSLTTSVPVPDPCVFGSPGHGFGSVIYLSWSGSGSFHQKAAKLGKILISAVLWLFIFEDWLNLPLKGLGTKTLFSPQSKCLHINVPTPTLRSSNIVRRNLYSTCSFPFFICFRFFRPSFAMLFTSLFCSRIFRNFFCKLSLFPGQFSISPTTASATSYRHFKFGLTLN